MMYLQLVAGLVVLMGAAEIMIRGAVGLARIFGLLPLLIGLGALAAIELGGTMAWLLVQPTATVLSGAAVPEAPEAAATVRTRALSRLRPEARLPGARTRGCVGLPARKPKEPAATFERARLPRRLSRPSTR